MKREDLTAADQWGIDGEERILCGRADEDDAAILDVGQQHILLSLVEAVQFVDEQDGASFRGFQFSLAFLEYLLIVKQIDGEPLFLSTGLNAMYK